MSQRPTTTLGLVIGMTAVACGGTTEVPPPEGQEPPQCSGAGYLAFDAANHAPQEVRLAAFAQMAAEMDAVQVAPFSPATAQAKFQEALRLYESSADLAAKVKGRKDDHLSGLPAIGVELDATIVGALEAGRTATTALSARMAQERVEKTLLRFFYLSVFHEMNGGNAKNWDEAYGYYGAPSDNAEAKRKGIAKMATERDATNGTTLESTIFNGLIDGSCELAKALAAAGTSQLDWKSVPTLKSAVEAVDRKLQEVFVYTAGHEALEMLEAQAELPTNPAATEDLWVELVELDVIFGAVEPYLQAAGGESAERSTWIREQIRNALADPTGAWMPTFPAQRIATELGTAYGLQIRQ